MDDRAGEGIDLICNIGAEHRTLIEVERAVIDEVRLFVINMGVYLVAQPGGEVSR